jgi:hypothetical protein
MDDWVREQKKLRILSVVLVVIILAIAVMIAISVLRGHI